MTCEFVPLAVKMGRVELTREIPGASHTIQLNTGFCTAKYSSPQNKILRPDRL